MAKIAFVTPILPGNLEAWRRFNQETLGSRASGHEAANQRLGITRELAWLQQTPAGDLAVVYLEVDDPERMFREMAISDDPYDIWFRQQVLDIHGLDLTQLPDGSLSELAYEWQASSGS